MIIIKKDTVIIKINYACPEYFASDLQDSIITAIQSQDPNTVDKEGLHDANYTLLELLRAII